MSQILCSICQEYIDFGQNIIVTVCKHVYHRSCIRDMRCVCQNWISRVAVICNYFVLFFTSHSHRSIQRNTLRCPICRSKLETKKETTLKNCYPWCEFQSSTVGPFIESIVCHRLIHSRCIMTNTPERYICTYCNWMIWNVRPNLEFRFVFCNK